MKKSNASPKLSNKLRKRAETWLLKRPAAINKISSTDINELMHELYIHQTELEMQNDELRTAQLALEQSCQRYVDLYDFAPIGYFLLDNEGVIEEVNLAGARLLGVEKRYLIKRKFYRFISPDCRDEFYQYCQNIFKNAKQQLCELKLIRKDGSSCFVQLSSTVIQHTIQGYGQFRIAITDVTQQREAQKNLRQRELELIHISRLTTMGEMVSGIAHELNQPLTAIIQYVGGCLARLHKINVDSNIIEAMEYAIVQAERAGAMIHHLKAFLKKEKPQIIALNVNEVIYSTLDLIEHEIKSAQIAVHLYLSDPLPTVKYDYIQLQQVILNIIYNAIEAMATAGVKSSQLSIYTHQKLENKIEVIIIDNGVGISHNHINKIFDPFFTTKIKGMGMGLSIVRSIIEQQGGQISVMSNPTIRGTQFNLLLPIA